MQNNYGSHFYISMLKIVENVNGHDLSIFIIMRQWCREQEKLHRKSAVSNQVPFMSSPY